MKKITVLDDGLAKYVEFIRHWGRWYKLEDARLVRFIFERKK